MSAEETKREHLLNGLMASGWCSQELLDDVDAAINEAVARALAESEKRVRVLEAALTVYANDSNWHTDDWNVSAVFVGPDGDGYADAPKYARAALLEGGPDAR